MAEVEQLKSMFTVYAIFNEKSHKIYIGQTIDLNLRLAQHNSTGGDHVGRFTKSDPGFWRLVYEESQESRVLALKREKQLKSYRGRQFIKNLIIKHP